MTTITECLLKRKYYFWRTDGAYIGSEFDLSESGDRLTVVNSNTPYSNYKSIAVYDYDNLNNVWNKKGQNISVVNSNSGACPNR